jgi:DNA-binding response OmpR family regulator
MLPRFRDAGDLVLDLLHRDARIDDRWIGLNPREFALLWRLAEEPDTPISKTQLLADVWRITHDPSTNSLAVHVARIRAKLRPYGLASLIATHPQAGYYLDANDRTGGFSTR